MNCLRMVAIAVLASACGGTNPPQPECRVGADCASGVCSSQGICQVSSTDGGAGGQAGGGSATGGGSTAGGSAGGSVAGGSAGGSTIGGGTATAGGSAGGSGGGTPGTCVPNFDGTITRSEVVTGPGLRATFRVSGNNATFDTAGTASADGGRVWDLTTNLIGDMNVLVETQAIQGQWFESYYPDAGYVVPLGQGSDLLAVFTSNADGLFLLGSASPADGTFATRLVYTPPVKVLQFPFHAGDTWSTASAVSGLASGVSLVTTPGIIGYTTDTYTSTVDRTGTAVTPYAQFPVLRVRTTMERVVTFNAFGNTSFRQYQYVTECFGTVATIRSQDKETSTEFTNAKEVRRLSR